MYTTFFGLRERPFELTPNPRFVFLTDQHREALSALQYGIRARRGITMLVGEAGTGKTTLVEAMLAAPFAQQVTCVRIANPTLTREEFIEHIARGFGLEVSGSKAALLARLDRMLHVADAGGSIATIIVDEAQGLPSDLLEEVRLLANIETRERKLLQVVLVGQPELASRLDEPALRQLRQRIAVRCELHALDIEQTAALISGRLRIAGGEPAEVFTAGAVRAIHEHARGIPRLVSVICDNALVDGFALERKPVDRQLVLEACRDLGLSRTTGVSPLSPARESRVADVSSKVAQADAKAASMRPLFTDIGRPGRFALFVR